MAILPICKNCRLFSEAEGECQVIILHEGKKWNLPVSANDKCFYENTFVSKEPCFNKEGDVTGHKTELFKPEVQEVRWWVEDDKGNKTNGDGRVKIQYPQGFFGANDPDQL